MNTVALLLVCIAYANGKHDYSGIPPPGSFPFVVALRHLRGYSYDFLCSGSIIKPQWVLTAGHCVFERNLVMDVDSRKIAGVIVVAGIDDLTEMGSIRKVQKYYTHPDFLNTPHFVKNDLALLQLDKPFEISKSIEPIRLGYYTDPAKHTVLAIGFGKIHHDKNASDEKYTELRYVPYITLEDRHCRLVHARIRVHPEDDEFKHICIAQALEYDICYGDSGGPLVDYESKVQVGMFSGPQDCDGYNPVLYIDLKHYLPWINNITKKVEAH